MSRPLVNTIIVAAASIVLGVAAAALGAYAFSQLRFRGKELLFLAYVGLLLIPSTLTLIPLFLTIQKLHLFNTWFALILPYAATAQPLLVLIFRGFFDQIPSELLESARIDGGTEAQVLMRIVAPLTRPVLLTGAILVTINVWGDYLWPTIVIQDPHRTTISAGVQQFVSSFGLNVSSGGSVFAAFVIATVPDVRPGRLHHALFRLRSHRRSNQAVTALPLTPAGLRCAHQADPLGVAPDRVRLSWRLEGAGTGRAQRAYQVLVTPDEPGASPRHGTAAGWSPRRRPDIAYGGPPADRGRPVQLEGAGLGRGRAASGWSDPARFEVELDRTSGWHASWIGPSRIREGVTPPSGPGPVDPVAQGPDPGSLPAPGLYRGPAGDVRPAVRDRARPVRGAAERPPGRRRVPHPRLDRLRPAHRLPDLRRDRGC